MKYARCMHMPKTKIILIEKQNKIAQERETKKIHSCLKKGKSTLRLKWAHGLTGITSPPSTISCISPLDKVTSQPPV